MHLGRPERSAVQHVGHPGTPFTYSLVVATLDEEVQPIKP